MSEAKPPIGTIRAGKDGSFLVFLRVKTSEGAVGHGFVVISVHDPNHKKIAAKIGTLQPGEERPWFGDE